MITNTTQYGNTLLKDDQSKVLNYSKVAIGTNMSYVDENSCYPDSFTLRVVSDYARFHI